MAETPKCHSLCQCKCGLYFINHVSLVVPFEPESHDVDCDVRKAELAAKIEAEKAKGGA